jgi:hypothetical protein
MASSISPLSYLNAYQSLPTSSSSSASSANTGVSATVELQAFQQNGNLQEFLDDSMAAAILQPSSLNSGTAASTLVNNMLQQVLGAYQAQGAS